MAKAYDLTNQRFGRLIAKNKCNYKKGNKYPWHCICDCGNEVDVRTQDLTRGKTQSCGCLRKEKASETGKKTVHMNFTHDFKDITGNVYGRLTALEREPNSHPTRWKCQCSCGNIVTIRLTDLTSGNTSSCGCMVSKGQEKISLLLNQYNIPFEKEKQFQDSMYSNTNGFFRFDFYVNNTYLIEYDGIQHYKENSFFNLSLAEQQQRDIEKNLWCKNHDIKLIRIPYYWYSKLTIKDLLLDTSGFVINI